MFYPDPVAIVDLVGSDPSPIIISLTLAPRLHLSDSTIGRLRRRRFCCRWEGLLKAITDVISGRLHILYLRYALEKTEWKQAVCSVCLEAPHNAVILLCLSHDKGCRPYMCGTSFRHS